MKILRLGMHGLRLDEEHLICNLMRMFAHNPSFRWRVSEGDEFEVLVVDAKQIQNTKIKRCARTVLRLSDEKMLDDPHVLKRPIQAGEFRDWLSKVEDALQFADSTQMQDTWNGESFNVLTNPRVLKFKLRRWPPTIMMQNDPVREHMAKLMSVDAFEVVELAQITGASLAECQAFVQKLQMVGLLDLVSKQNKSNVPQIADSSPRGRLTSIRIVDRLERWRDRFGF